MTQLTIQSKNRLEQGELISQELNTKNNEFRRWIAIYPLKEDGLKKKYEGFKYKVIDFELNKQLVDEFFSEDDKKNSKEYFVISESELLKLFLEIGVDPQKFDVPWKNDYPL